MNNTEQLRSKLLDKLKELFQLNQPDLDFGFYRIMHARAREVSDFIEHDLLDTIKTAFDTANSQTAETELETLKKEIITNFGDGAFDSNGILKRNIAEFPLGKKYLAAQKKFDDAQTALTGEDSVYYHLYRFFSRYYDNGDFVSMRYHTRETEGKARPYAIPYGGEEVMLHWANADQYYIKTSECFRNFSFDLAKAKELTGQPDGELKLSSLPDQPMPVHFKIAEADEGEHGNIKADDKKKRGFYPAPEKIAELNDAGELVVYFEFRYETEEDRISDEDGKALDAKYKSSAKGNRHLLYLTDKVIEAVEALRSELKKSRKDTKKIDLYLDLLNRKVPTDGIKERILLTKYLYKYTASNTSDYFIHKNLKAFLLREMDFYIKNEIMNLDDVMNSDVHAVENYLVLLKVFRKIAGKLIDFLGQLEDFQKKLWLKKKFVVQCDYCITLDRVPEEFYPEIANNDKQREEWVKLCAIDRISARNGGMEEGGWIKDVNGRMDTAKRKVAERKFGYSIPLEVGFLKENRFLMVDTKFFSDDFKSRLLASIEDFDKLCDGLLIHSENFQALNLLQQRYKEQVSCVYIDPPYNTGNDGFLYRDNYQHSNWLTMLQNRLLLSQGIQQSAAPFFISIDENEIDSLNFLCKKCINTSPIANFIWRSRAGQAGTINIISQQHEYVLCYSKDKNLTCFNQIENVAESGNYSDDKGSYKREQLRQWGQADRREDRPQMFYGIPNPLNNSELVFPKRSDRSDGRWRVGYDSAMELLANGDLDFVEDENHNWSVYKKIRDGRITFNSFGTILPDSTKTTAEGSKSLSTLFHDKVFSYPKPIELLNFLISLPKNNMLVLDFFAGSGTTGHATINLNKGDKKKRKYILIEMGDYFDTVLKPRIEKVVYASNWKDGFPMEISSIKGKQIIEGKKKVQKSNNDEEDLLSWSATFKGTELEDNPEWKEDNPYNGISHCFKYMRLESYEDTLNNLVMPETDSMMQKTAGPASLREDYALHYMLDTEAADSLLNVNDFADPFGGYHLNIKQSGSEASVKTPVDLVETFNYLIGLRVEQYYRIQSYKAGFKRSRDPELPKNQNTRWELDGKPELCIGTADPAGYPWRFQKIEGKIPANPLTPNDGKTLNVLIVWRTQTKDPVYDNLMLDWYLGQTVNPNEKTPEYDIIYINGSNNLGADRKETDFFQVRLIEEEFLKQMWAQEEI